MSDSLDSSLPAITSDLVRLLTYIRQHPAHAGALVAIGHSLGASHLLQLGPNMGSLNAVVLIGPSRHQPDHQADWDERVRYSADRGFARLMPQAVVDAEFARTELDDFAARRRAEQGPPILLLDGEHEGQALTELLAGVAAQAGAGTRHVTVPGSHHYCGAYQLPWPLQTNYVRPDVFERCFEAISDFLAEFVTGAPPI